MASGDAVAPTAIDRPQCFIEKEKACFPCREFLVCRVVCFLGDDVCVTTTSGIIYQYMYIFIYGVYYSLCFSEA